MQKRTPWRVPGGNPNNLLLAALTNERLKTNN